MTMKWSHKRKHTRRCSLRLRDSLVNGVCSFCSISVHITIPILQTLPALQIGKLMWL